MTQKDSNKLKSLIAQGKEKEAISILLKSLNKENSNYNELVLISNNYKIIEKRQRLGLHYEPKEKNQINYNLLELISSIESQDSPTKLNYKTTSHFIKLEKRNNLIYISISGISVAGLIYFLGLPILSLFVSFLILIVLLVYNFMEN